MENHEVVALVEAMGGTAGTAQLRRVLSRSELEGIVIDGDLVPVTRGRYAVASTPADQVAAVSVSGVLSGLSAARWWGWSLKTEPRRTEVTVPRDRVAARLERADLDVRRRDLPRGAAAGFVLTRPHTVVDCARWLPFDEALCVADSALRSRTVSRGELHAVAATVPRTGRRRVRAVLAAADPRAANPFESTVRAVALGVADLVVEPQGTLDGIGHADLLDDDLRIVVECDSWAYHAGEAPFRHDVRRYTAMTRTGRLVVRFVWEDAMQRPDRVRRALEDVVALRRSDTQFADVFARRRLAG